MLLYKKGHAFYQFNPNKKLYGNQVQYCRILIAHIVLACFNPLQQMRIKLVRTIFFRLSLLYCL